MLSAEGSVQLDDEGSMTEKEGPTTEPKEPEPNDFRVALAKGLMSSVPVLGPIATEFVNAEIQKRAAKNLEVFQNELLAITSEQADRISRVEEEIRPKDWIRAARSNEIWQPKVFARILMSDPNDLSKITKQILVEHVSSLTNYDVWLLMQLTTNKGRQTMIDLYTQQSIAEMEAKDQNIEFVRESSYEKMSQMKLVTKQNGSYELTSLGETVSYFVH
jgi:hypothetical protein